ncbi:MAG: hypothetical protein NTY09_11310 [bacterium]|nr:hypothetical protein [bacterium]
MKVKKFRIEMFLVLVLMSVNYSCAEKAAGEETRSLGEYEEVSIDPFGLMLRGNCLPFVLDGININTTIAVSNAKVTSMSFLNPNEIVCVTEEGKVFICEIDTGAVTQIASLSAPGRILAHNSNEFLVTSEYHTDEPEDRWYIRLACMNKNGEIYWNHENLTMPSGDIYGHPAFDGENYIMVDGDNDRSIGLFRLKSDGSDFELFDSDVGTYSYGQMIKDGQIIWFTCRSGPFISVRDETGYSRIQLWNTNWNNGLDMMILDRSNRLVGFKIGANPIGITNSLVILEKGDVEPIEVEYDLALNLVRPSASNPIFSQCASNSDNVLILADRYLLKYTDGAIKIWHDNLDDFADSYSTTEEILEDGTIQVSVNLNDSHIFTDITGEHFLILQRGSIMYGGDEIQVLDLGGIASRNIYFTPDYHRACLALDNGTIVVLDLETSNPEP